MKNRLKHFLVRTDYTRELLLLAVVAFALGWFWPEKHWLLDVTGHFVVHYTLFALVVLPWLVFKRYWIFTVLAVVLIGAGVYRLQPLSATHEAACVVPKPMTAVVSNLLYTNTDLDGIAQSLAEQNADIIGVVEMTFDMRDRLRTEFAGEYEYAAYPESWAAGAGLWSRYPLRSKKVEWFGERKIPYLRVSVAHPQVGELYVYVLHAWSPGPNGRTPKRDAYLRHVADEIGKLSKHTPVIVMGDLNTTRFVPVLPDMVETAGLNDPSPFVPLGTWPSLFHRLGVQIDHILTKCLPRPRLSAFSVTGSDHRALKAEFVPPEAKSK